MTMLTNKLVLTVLQQAKQSISKKANWTQGATARNEDGVIVLADADCAVCFCTMGAVNRAVSFMCFTEKEEVWLTRTTLGKLRIELFAPFHSLSEFNDSSTHAEVIALFDKTIAAVTQE